MKQRSRAGFCGSGGIEENLMDKPNERDQLVIDGMARALFANAWADAAEQKGISLSGQEILDVMPMVTPAAKEAATRLAQEFERLNGKPVSELFDEAMQADGIKDGRTGTDDQAREFGHYLALQAVGAGVSWFDDHKEFPIKFPPFEFEVGPEELDDYRAGAFAESKEITEMQLLTKELEKLLPAVGSTEQVSIDDKMIVAKFFNPTGAQTWLAAEYDPENREFFGPVWMFPDVGWEWGYFSLDELQSVKGRFGLGIERDLHFRPAKFSEVRAEMARTHGYEESRHVSEERDETPWGEIQNQIEIVPGVLWVDTASHGGLMVLPATAQSELSNKALKYGELHSGYLFYEEDVRFLIPFYERPEWSAIFFAKAGGQEPTKDRIRAGIMDYYPEYFEQKESRQVSEAKTHKDVEFQIGGQTYSTFNEAAVAAVLDSIKKGNAEVNLDTLIWSEVGARAFGGDDAVEQYKKNPDLSVFERITIKADIKGPVV